MTDKSGGKLMTGADLVALAAADAGAQMMYGYPITPSTEVLTGWIKLGKPYLQTEDEISAGFCVCGGILAGQVCFTATAGPGNILMQDAISMAEGMRLPFVGIIAQRGGPSSGTVIYSQQEVFLTCFGGNGEGHRIVYSPASLWELYQMTRQAFLSAWNYNFPSFLLTDGYLLKTRGVVNVEEFKKDEKTNQTVDAKPFFNEEKHLHWRNIYTFEEELSDEVLKSEKDFQKMSKDIAEYETVAAEDAEILLIAHGIVGASVKMATDELRKQGIKAGYFRPKTLRPFPYDALNEACGRVKRIVVIESSVGQLARLVKENLNVKSMPAFDYLQKPAMGIEAEEVVDFVKNII